MERPVLVVMAAGMGSRYGGLKQIDPVGVCAEAILDYSLFDAYRAGFRTAVIIIKKQIEQDFLATIGRRLARCPMEIRYAYQELEKLPPSYSPPKDRKKPFGTGHAILCAKDAIGDAPFAVINADDYYGRSAFRQIFSRLSDAKDTEFLDFCMVGYSLRNTLSSNGGVARGICTVDKDGDLSDIWECIGIEKRGAEVGYSKDGQWAVLDPNTTVSMNMFGFTSGIFPALERDFLNFLAQELPQNPEKAELYLPTVVDHLMKAGKAKVRVLPTAERWFGVTYAADKPVVVRALAELTEQGAYPVGLWR